MKRFLLALSFLYAIVPSYAAGADAPLTRRDGFLMIWSSIHRPADAMRKAGFSDVALNSKGGGEIAYAKYRGLLDGDDAFHPDEPLQLSDALLWILRTRNVDSPDLLTVDELPALAMQYGLAEELMAGSGSGKEVIKKALTKTALADLLQQTDDFLANQSHEVSLYSEKFQGKGTAFGETFDMNALTAAHRTFPHNTLVRVTNIANGKSVVVRINDRGPYVAGRDMDLSLGAFTQIADRSKGKIQARFERMGDVTMAQPEHVAEVSVAFSCSSHAENQIRITKDIRLIGGVPNVMHLGEHLALKANQAFVLRDVTYPDGTLTRFDRRISPSTGYDFLPALAGSYIFHFATSDGHVREMTTNVSKCG
jgi:rare lipoprotein A